MKLQLRSHDAHASQYHVTLEANYTSLILGNRSKTVSPLPSFSLCRHFAIALLLIAVALLLITSLLIAIALCVVASIAVASIDVASL